MLYMRNNVTSDYYEYSYRCIILFLLCIIIFHLLQFQWLEFIQAIFGRDDVNIIVDITIPVVNRDPDYKEKFFSKLNSYSKRFLYCIIYLKLCDLCSFVSRKQLSRLNLLIAGGTLNEILGKENLKLLTKTQLYKIWVVSQSEKKPILNSQNYPKLRYLADSQ